MQWVSRAGPRRICVSRKPSPSSSSRCSSGNFEPVEFEFAHPAMLFRPHDPDAPHDAPARIVLVIEKGGKTAARIIGCARHENEMARHRGARDEPFSSVDDIFVAALLGLGQHHAAGIGARARLRLGHREGRAHLAVDDRLQPAVLLGVSFQNLVEHRHVAVIRRLAIEDDRTEDRAVALPHRRAAQPTIGNPRPPRSFGICGAHRPAARALARMASSTSSRIFSYSS